MQMWPLQVTGHIVRFFFAQNCCFYLETIILTVSLDIEMNDFEQEDGAIDLFIEEITNTSWNPELNNVRGTNCFQLTPPILSWIRGKEPNIDNVMKMMVF